MGDIIAFLRGARQTENSEQFLPGEKMDNVNDEIRLNLTEDERDLFLMMQGMAVGVAMRDGNKQMADALLRLTNKINAGNPDFAPCEVPEG
jgi:hypothetical protein